MFEHEPGSFEVHIKEDIEVLLAALKQLAAPHDSGVVDENVDGFPYAGESVLYLLTLGDVDVVGGPVWDLLHHMSSVHCRDDRAFRNECMGDCAANPAARAGDEHMFSFEFHSVLLKVYHFFCLLQIELALALG